MKGAYDRVGGCRRPVPGYCDRLSYRQGDLVTRMSGTLPVADLLSRDFVRLVAPEEHANLIDCRDLQLGRLAPGVDRRCGIRRQRRDVDGRLVRMRRGIVRQN